MIRFSRRRRRARPHRRPAAAPPSSCSTRPNVARTDALAVLPQTVREAAHIRRRLRSR